MAVGTDSAKSPCGLELTKVQLHLLGFLAVKLAFQCNEMVLATIFMLEVKHCMSACMHACGHKWTHLWRKILIIFHRRKNVFFQPRYKKVNLA